MTNNNLSGKDEALLILEYLENEQMSKTFLNFLDENKHLHHLRSRLYANYENSQEFNYENDSAEVNEFQTFFHLSKQQQQQNDQLTFLPDNTKSNPNDLFFDDDFLNDLISQTPPMDYSQDFPDTPIPSVVPILNNENEDFNSTMSSIEQLFAVQHDHHPPTPIISETNSSSRTPYTKCIVVTQEFLQSMYNPQSTITNNNMNHIHRPKYRRRRLKGGKENLNQQRKIMPRTSPDYQIIKD